MDEKEHCLVGSVCVSLSSEGPPAKRKKMFSSVSHGEWAAAEEEATLTWWLVGNTMKCVFTRFQTLSREGKPTFALAAPPGRRPLCVTQLLRGWT